MLGVFGWFDRTLDIVVATHPDLDHIGGLVNVLDRYQVNSVITTSAKGNSLAATELEKKVMNTKAPVVYAKAGQVLELGASTTLSIFSPQYDPDGWPTNSGSIITLLQHGDIGFMLTGDAPVSIEEFLVKHYGQRLEAEVLKLGHHGSKTSSAKIFLEAVDPEFVVVSAGKNNSHGHPHDEVLARVAEIGARVASTQEGTVTFHSDGKSVFLLD